MPEELKKSIIKHLEGAGFYVKDDNGLITIDNGITEEIYEVGIRDAVIVAYASLDEDTIKLHKMLEALDTAWKMLEKAGLIG
ncbi:hypothetical protein [Methanococcus maripaludis]|uniref:Uncharacterized protein n=2 Tax=Methanococcus maripaludis TaxID=39152 RepID=A0A7J9PI46_METMI|nr:hypothetical protein [Methanococcus maripaludis]MBA2862905.1 hypothetical protein [Methanococcus maripaludis]